MFVHQGSLAAGFHGETADPAGLWMGAYEI